MRRILFLMFFLLPVFSFGQRAIVSYPHASSANLQSFFFGSQADMGNQQFQYSVLDIFYAMLPFIRDSVSTDTAGAINIGNTNLTLTGDRALECNNHLLAFDHFISFGGTNNLNDLAFAIDVNDVEFHTHNEAGRSNVPIIVAQADSLDQTAAITTLISYTTTRNADFDVTVYASVTVDGGHTFSSTLEYTDVHGTVITRSILGLGSSVNQGAITWPIRAKSGTTIKIGTSLGSSGTITYDVGALIVQKQMY